MPLFQYTCPACGKQVEDLRKYQDRNTSPPQCEECGEETELDDVQEGSSFRCMGGGWFNTGGY